MSVRPLWTLEITLPMGWKGLWMFSSSGSSSWIGLPSRSASSRSCRSLWTEKKKRFFQNDLWFFYWRIVFEEYVLWDFNISVRLELCSDFAPPSSPERMAHTIIHFVLFFLCSFLSFQALLSLVSCPYLSSRIRRTLSTLSFLSCSSKARCSAVSFCTRSVMAS